MVAIEPWMVVSQGRSTNVHVTIQTRVAWMYFLASGR